MSLAGEIHFCGNRKKTKEIFFPLGNCEMSEVANARKKNVSRRRQKYAKKEQLGTKPSPQFHFPLCSVQC